MKEQIKHFLFFTPLFLREKKKPFYFYLLFCVGGGGGGGGEEIKNFLFSLRSFWERKKNYLFSLPFLLSFQDVSIICVLQDHACALDIIGSILKLCYPITTGAAAQQDDVENIAHFHSFC